MHTGIRCAYQFTSSCKKKQTKCFALCALSVRCSSQKLTRWTFTTSHFTSRTQNWSHRTLTNLLIVRLNKHSNKLYITHRNLIDSNDLKPFKSHQPISHVYELSTCMFKLICHGTLASVFPWKQVKSAHGLFHRRVPGKHLVRTKSKWKLYNPCYKSSYRSTFPMKSSLFALPMMPHSQHW